MENEELLAEKVIAAMNEDEVCDIEFDENNCPISFAVKDAYPHDVLYRLTKKESDIK
jgi:hypothetical protein